MKKMLVLQSYPPQIRDVLKKLERGEMYLLKSSSRKYNDIPVILTHFYKKGLRCKQLTTSVPKFFQSFPLIKHADIFSIPYSAIYTDGVTFEKLPLEMLPLYLNRASKWLKEKLGG